MSFGAGLQQRVIDAKAAFQQEVARYQAEVESRVDAFVASKVEIFKEECISRADSRHSDISTFFEFDGGLASLVNRQLGVTCGAVAHCITKKLREQLQPLGFTELYVEAKCSSKGQHRWIVNASWAASRVWDSRKSHEAEEGNARASTVACHDCRQRRLL
mmetsp:Transcript_85890/g.237921  ORF Transcript_85890/g.237921 Transcript_85890/m.237921 type:complete len:160 (-) Transcript_85890:277-756(-)